MREAVEAAGRRALRETGAAVRLCALRRCRALAAAVLHGGNEVARAALLALLPGPVWLKIALPLFVLFSTLFMATIFSPMVREKRLYQHGYLPEVVLRDDD